MAPPAQNSDLVRFGELSEMEKRQLKIAQEEGSVEVHCGWWAAEHWEKKGTGDFFDEAFYRIRRHFPRSWSQGGFLVVSGTAAMPLVHSWHCAEWMANDDKTQREKELPADLRANLSVVPANISFFWPNVKVDSSQAHAPESK